MVETDDSWYPLVQDNAVYDTRKQYHGNTLVPTQSQILSDNGTNITYSLPQCPPPLSREHGEAC